MKTQKRAFLSIFVEYLFGGMYAILAFYRYQFELEIVFSHTTKASSIWMTLAFSYVFKNFLSNCPSLQIRIFVLVS